jgi:hypothetical protein
MTSPHPYHYGVVVGINAYPGGYMPLNGPVNDATAFAEWLRDPEQGGLPKGNVQLIVTPKRPPKRPNTARPTKQLIDEALVKAHEDLEEDLAKLPEEERGAARNASRLYLFVAGHGIMPGEGEAALLDATARRPRYQPNVELQSYLMRIKRNGAFAEVCAFADCCRTAELLTIAGQIFLTPPLRGGGPVTTLLALATTAGDLAFEEIKDSADADLRRGYFSRTLMEGLRGNAADPRSGLVTTSGLRSYVTPILAELTKDKPVPQKAEFYAAEDMVFGPPRSRTEGRPPGRAGRKVVIRFPEWAEDDTVELVAPDGSRMAWEPVDGPWTVRLYDGEWYVQRAGSAQDTRGFAHDGVFSVQGVDRVVDL